MIRPQGGAAVASACRMRSITTGVPRPGTCAQSSPQKMPAKIDGITGCFSMVTTAPPSLPSRPSRELPCWPTSIRNDDRVSMTSEFMLMIISSGTRPGVAVGVGDEGDADADAVREDRRQAEHGGLAQPHARRAAERHGGEIEQQARTEEHEQDVERQRLEPHLRHRAEEQRREQRVEGDVGQAAQALGREQLRAPDQPADRHRAEHRHDDVEDGVHFSLGARHSSGAFLSILHGAGRDRVALAPQ